MRCFLAINRPCSSFSLYEAALGWDSCSSLSGIFLWPSFFKLKPDPWYVRTSHHLFGTKVPGSPPLHLREDVLSNVPYLLAVDSDHLPSAISSAGHDVDVATHTPERTSHPISDGVQKKQNFSLDLGEASSFPQ
jgi:hypothetical protein